MGRLRPFKGDGSQRNGFLHAMERRALMIFAGARQIPFDRALADAAHSLDQTLALNDAHVP